MPSIRIRSPHQTRLKRAILEMTARCNLFCVHCSRASGLGDYPDEMPTEKWLDVTAQLHNYGVDMLVLGGGEPLLQRKRVIAIVEQAARLQKLTRITTNGLLLDVDLARFFRDHGGIVSYGMDGLDPGAYESFRGGHGTYAKVRRAIDLGLKYEILDVLAITATKVNLEQVPKVIDFCAEIGVTCVVSKYVPTGRDNYQQLLLEPAQRKQMLDLIDSKRREHPHIQVTTTREPLEGVALGTGGMDDFGCIAGTGWCLVSATGEVQPCPYFPLVLGNVLENSFAEIWEFSSHLRALRHRSGYGGHCGSCVEQESCGGCRALAYALTGDYLAEDPQCWIHGPVDLADPAATAAGAPVQFNVSTA